MSEDLWQALKKGSDRAALFIIRKDPNKQTKQNLMSLLSFLTYTTVILVLLINIIQHDQGIVIAVINGIFLLNAVVMVEITLDLIRKKDKIVEVISWCTEPFCKKFPKSMQHDAGKRFMRIHELSTMITLFQIKLFDFFAIMGSLGVATILQFIPSMRYQLPFPFHLPVEDYKNWTAFSITLLLQFLSSFIVAQMGGFFVSLLILFFLHVKEFLNIIWNELDTLKRSFNDAKIKEKLDLDQSLRDLVRMICSVVRLLLYLLINCSI